MNYREIAIDYINSKEYHAGLEDYINHFNIKDIDVKKLNFYIKVEENISKRENKIKVLKELFNNNTAVEFKNVYKEDKRAIFHICSKEGSKYQISFVDDIGAEMDIAGNTIDIIIDKFLAFYNSYSTVVQVIK